MSVFIPSIEKSFSAGIPIRVWQGIERTMATMLLVLSSPLLLTAALLLKVSSREPMLYVSWRPGLDGQVFPCYKLRTMRPADNEFCQESWGVDHKTQSEHPRVTRIGRLLRRSSIDELPQLWNVIRGQMSLVGPRPLTYSDYLLLPKWAKARYSVKPGLTGLWQVSGRSDLPLERMLQLDLEYIQLRSRRLDRQILLNTIPAVLTARGAR